MDDPERDPDFVILDEDLEEAEVQPSSSILSGLSQQESVEKGIPQLPKKGLYSLNQKRNTDAKFATKGSKEHLNSRITITHSI